jgi:hypothetical protein
MDFLLGHLKLIYEDGTAAPFFVDPRRIRVQPLPHYMYGQE